MNESRSTLHGVVPINLDNDTWPPMYSSAVKVLSTIRSQSSKPGSSNCIMILQNKLEPIVPSFSLKAN